MVAKNFVSSLCQTRAYACCLSLCVAVPKYTLTPALAAVVGAAEMSRTEAVKVLWEYIRRHGLQKESDKRIVVCDAKLKKVMGGEVSGLNSVQVRCAIARHWYTHLFFCCRMGCAALLFLLPLSSLSYLLFFRPSFLIQLLNFLFLLLSSSKPSFLLFFCYLDHLFCPFPCSSSS